MTYFPLFGKSAVRNMSARGHCRKTSSCLWENGGLSPRSPHIKDNEPLDITVEQFLASLRFQQRGKLDQLGIEIGSID